MKFNSTEGRSVIFCKDCFWETSDKVRKFCSSPNNITFDPTEGKPIARFTRAELRRKPDECGPEGTWFVNRTNTK